MKIDPKIQLWRKLFKVRPTSIPIKHAVARERDKLSLPGVFHNASPVIIMFVIVNIHHTVVIFAVNQTIFASRRTISNSDKIYVTAADLRQQARAWNYDQ